MKYLIENKFNLEYYIKYIHVPIKNMQFLSNSALASELFMGKIELNMLYSQFVTEYFNYVDNILPVLNYNKAEIKPEEEKILNNHIQQMIYAITTDFMKYWDIYSLNEQLDKLANNNNTKSTEIAANILAKLLSHDYENQFKLYLSQIIQGDNKDILFTKDSNNTTILETLFLEMKWELVNWIKENIAYSKSSDLSLKDSLHYICRNLDTEFIEPYNLGVDTSLADDFFTSL
ncbi:MAG: hypothetical protein HRU35_00005 [Rickettsiaceae bacterium]|nr:hypothetical protein [Rickettsiaceae bacterium]